MDSVLKRIGLAAVASTIAVPAMAADVVIGVPNWPSVLATAHVLKVALEENLGLEVELQNGTNPVVFESDGQWRDACPSGSLAAESAEPLSDLCRRKGYGEEGTRTSSPAIRACASPRQPLSVPASKTSPISPIRRWPRISTPTATGWARSGSALPAGRSTNVEKIRAKSYGYDATMTLKEMDEDSGARRGRQRGRPGHQHRVLLLHARTTCLRCMSWCS